MWVKESKPFSKLFNLQKILSLNPVLTKSQINYFKNILELNSVKLIHAHFGPSGLEILPLAKVLNIPLVVTFHGYDASVLLKYNTYVKNLKELFKYAHIIVISEKMKCELVDYGANPEKIEVIRCGIPINYFSYVQRPSLKLKMIRNEKVNYLQVSNFVEKKGHRFTVEAFSLFHQKYPNAHLTLAGGGVLLNEIKELVISNNLSEAVTFTGFVDEGKVKILMHNADVFIHHSITSKSGDKEGIPTVLMEAMSTGLPVISTFHSGIPELIITRKNGLLVTEKDITEYSNKLYEILLTGDNFREEARRIVAEKFNLEIETNRIIDLYQSLIRRNCS